MKPGKIYLMDTIEGLKSLGDNSVDLIVTDPPYGIADEIKKTIHRGKLQSTKEAWGKWDSFHPFDYDTFIRQVLSECYRVLKPGGSIYMFLAVEQVGHFVRKAVQRGFKYRKLLAIVKKTPQPSIYKNSWRGAFELCMYLTKGTTKTFNFISQSDLVNVYTQDTRRRESKHPTEKPLELIRRMIKVSSKPGDLVLDPFMGSGTTAVACKQLGRQFLGFERDLEYLKMAEERLRKAVPDEEDRDVAA